jgi:glycosyltransferase involved in cell wall biosynthesis
MNEVSVVILVYSVKPYLERCVNSVLRQINKAIEIVLVDDGIKDCV